MSEVVPWGKPGTPAQGRTNYDTINGGAPIASINGATGPDDSGYHDPYQKPPDGFTSWHDVGQANMDSIQAAVIRQDALEAAGYKYNKRNGTWVDPNGGTTTLFSADQGPPGGVDYHWDESPRSEREQTMDAYSDDPRRPYDIEGEVDDDDQEGETGAVGLFHWAANQSIWGKFLKLFGK